MRNKIGPSKWVTEVVAENVQFLESKDKSGGNTSQQSASQPAGDFGGEPVDFSDDDLPF